MTDGSEEEIIDPRKKFNYPESPSIYEIDEFVYCFFKDENGMPREDFGTITNYIPPNMYVIKLHTMAGWASVPIDCIRKAGRS